MRIELQKIREIARDSKDLHGYIDSIFERCLSDGDVPLLSDMITEFNRGGVYIMEALAHKYAQDRDMPMELRFRWKILAMRDEWGNVPQPGDQVLRRIQKPLEYGPGKPVPAGELSLDIMNGVYDQKWNRYIPYTVDEKGCITCEFNDAVHFIRCWGVHPKSGLAGPPLSLHSKEHSIDVVDAPDGKKYHVWYWRFKEMDKEDYANLPVIKPNKEPKRGYKD